ncbi:MAG: FHA domain-containing protein [Planctomycetota bacterium]
MLTLIQFNPDERAKPQTFHLSADQPHVIGRRNGDIQLLDSRISRQHAEISVQNGTWVIRDLNSSNGTWVNGDRVEGLCELEEGDRLLVGRITLIVGHVHVDETEVGITMPKPSTELATEAPTLTDEAEPETTSEINKPDNISLENEVDLEPIDFDGVIDEAPSPASPSVEEMASSADEAEGSSPPQENADLVDLNEASAGEGVGLSASSLGPTLSEPQKIEGESAADLSQEEDEYAASMDFVTPTTRPNSPLDDSDTPLELPTVEETAEATTPAADEHEDAPPIVGLSLDMPGPSDGSGEEQEDTADDLDDSLQASLELSDLPADDDDSTEASDEQITKAKGTPASVEERTEPDWGESEEQQELSPEWSSSRGFSGKKKGLIALVLLALAGGVAYWAINMDKSDGPIADVSPDNTATEPAASTMPTPTPAPSKPSTTQSTPPNPPAPKPEAPATAPPPVEVAEADDTPEAPKSNAFGQAPTLTAPPPQATRPQPTPTPPVVAETPASEPAPADAAAEATAEVDTPQTPPAPTVPVEPETNTGPTVALLDPPPVAEPLVTPTPVQPTEPDEVAPPAEPVSVADAKRLVFVIDASGSMVDSMNQGALSWLEQRLASLSDHDQFAVLFFRDNEIIEVPPLGLKPGDSLSQEHTLAWVSPDAGHVRPRGKSAPLNALQQALQYEPTDLYILSDDKFGQRKTAAAVDVRDLESLLGSQSPLIHTVQFFYPSPDDRRLEAIAKRFGGTYEFVEEPPFDVNPGDSLGLDLLGISR